MSSGTHNLFSFEKLKGIDNYNSWKFMMRMTLIHEDLWDVVQEKDEKAIDQKKDQKALAKIALSVSPAAIPHIRCAKRAYEAWNNLVKAYEDKGLSRRLGLLRTLFATKLNECENMEVYLNKITEIAQQLCEIGSALEDDFVAVIMLSGLTSDYDPFIMAIENSNIKLSSELVKGKLLQENLRRDDKTDSASALITRKQQPKCFRCKRTGHFIKDCPKAAQTSKKTTKNNTGDSKALLTALSANIKKEFWYIDSGATGHMCGDKNIMSDLVLKKSLEVKIANGDILHTSGQGTVRVRMKNGDLKTISNVHYVPNLTTNLLSVSAMVQKGFKVVFGSSGCKIHDNGKIMATATLRDGVYQLDTTESPLVYCNFVENKCTSFTEKFISEQTPIMNELQVHQCDLATGYTETAKAHSVMKDVASQEVWHRRLGHLNHRSMDLLMKGMALGIKYDTNIFHQCVSCIKGKQTRLPFPKKSFNRATESLELVHTDLCGPMPCASFSGAKYFLSFIDDYTRKTFVYFLRRKDEVFKKFTEWKALVENQSNKRLKTLRSDNGGEYINSKFQSYLTEHGIRHETTVPHSPQQNGVAERANRSIMEKSRCMLQEAGLGNMYWAEAVNTAVYLKNRSPTIAVKGSTPEEKWTNKKVIVSHLRIFGCIAYARKHIHNKLDARAKQYIFVGYCEETKGYRLIDPENPKNCIKARDITFLENKYFVSHDDTEDIKHITPSSNTMYSSDTDGQVPSTTETFTVDLSDDTNRDEQIQAQSVESQRLSTITVNDSDSGDSYVADDSADETYIPDETLDEEESSQDFEYEDSEMGMLACMLAEVGNMDEPQKVNEALHGPEANNWRQAMQDEYESFNLNKCWTLTDRIQGQKPVKCKWVFKRKYGLNGELLKYKARLVAKGYTQKAGIDYEETFSPVVRYSSIRTLLAIAAEHHLDIEHLDVKTAFLNGELKETVFMEQPEGFISKGNEDKVYKLNKAVYGLKQASKAWYEKINNTLCEKLKFQRTYSEPCVYYKSSHDSLIIIALYVDDILLFSTANSHEKDKIKEKLKGEFDITDLGPARHILGMRICKFEDKITLDQTNYIEKVLKKFNMEECKPSATPMETGLKLTKSSVSQEDCVKYDYRGLIGSLMYIAVGSRPDISHAVSYLSQFNNCYSEVHWKIAKRVLRYLKGTKDYHLTFQAGGMDIIAYADADWGRNEGDRRSYTGFVFKVGTSIVSWESRKQRTVALSSTEAEYMSLSDACKEALFIRKFIKEILNKSIKVTVFNDNQSAQKLCRNSMFHARTKHIDIRHHFIRENVSSGIIDIKYLCTNNMVADLLTKPLSREKHDNFTVQLLSK